jgi:hypothetical protein
MCSVCQRIHKERRKEALGAGSVEELGCITSKLRNAILIHGFKCGSDLGEASKVHTTMIECSSAVDSSRSRIKQFWSGRELRASSLVRYTSSKPSRFFPSCEDAGGILC